MNTITRLFYLRSASPCKWRKSPDTIRTARNIITANASDTVKVQSIITYICRALEYAHVKAIQGGSYASDPDDTLRLRLGTCLDYAVLFCAMCRSQGIPCKVIYGYATTAGKTVNHAWNQAYHGGAWHEYDLTYKDSGKTAKYERTGSR
jgi:transglutaminase-like putative cysteine protease